jgi:hypothetical protein
MSMRRSFVSRIVLLVAVVVVVVAAPGCALFNSLNQPQIIVQMSSRKVLHVAALPRVLPDGRSADEAREKLLNEVAEQAGGYTLIDNVLGGWVPPGNETAVQERNDLLLVRGGPELAFLLRARLLEDFQQQVPFVESVPLQAIAVVYPDMPPLAGPPTPGEEAMEEMLAPAE